MNTSFILFSSILCTVCMCKCAHTSVKYILYPVNFFCYCKNPLIGILFWIDNEHESIKRAEIDTNDR